MYLKPRTYGFTLIELMVSVALFSVVMLLVASSYLRLVSLDEQARATNNVVNNLSFAVDSMERSIRTGTNYSTNGPSSFSFLDDQGRNITYDLSNGVINECVSSTCSALTDPAITITTLTFNYNGAVSGGTTQPQVSFLISGSMPAGHNVPSTFTIEGAATERFITVPAT